MLLNLYYQIHSNLSLALLCFQDAMRVRNVYLGHFHRHWSHCQLIETALVRGNFFTRLLEPRMRSFISGCQLCFLTFQAGLQAYFDGRTLMQRLIELTLCTHQLLPLWASVLLIVLLLFISVDRLFLVMCGSLFYVLQNRNLL